MKVVLPYMQGVLGAGPLKENVFKEYEVACKATLGHKHCQNLSFSLMRIL